MSEKQCPHCKHKYDYEQLEKDLEGKYGDPFYCDGCGRRLRVEIEGGTMYCDNCDCEHECDECANDIRLRIWCWDFKMHDWKATLSDDIEKCSLCSDIRRIPQSKS